MLKNERKKRILVLTPTFSGGSWLFTERILEKLSRDNTQIFIIGLGKILVKKGASIGTNSVILFDITIGEYAMDRLSQKMCFHFP